MSGMIVSNPHFALLLSDTKKTKKIFKFGLQLVSILR